MTTKVAVLAVIASSLSGCYAEGHSYFLGNGDSQYFLTMSACEREALAGNYAGFLCTEKFAVFTIEKRDFYNKVRKR